MNEVVGFSLGLWLGFENSLISKMGIAVVNLQKKSKQRLGVANFKKYKWAQPV